MKNITIDNTVRLAAPGLRVVQIEAPVVNSPTTDALWEEICLEAERIAQMPRELVNKRPGIAATRAAYKALGKDPNRYRPSAEALCRRIVRDRTSHTDIGIYRLSTLIDLINLLSIATGYSIGGFDLDKIAGENLVLGRGEADENFTAIGRGPLNIDGLPVYRDSVGGIGTPTSDEERTKITDDTKRLLMTINIYGEETPVEQTIAMAKRLLTTYSHTPEQDIKVRIIE